MKESVFVFLFFCICNQNQGTSGTFKGIMWAFPQLSICPRTFFFSFVFNLPHVFFLGATQEGVYRTVGSNIQVQKLLNAFFGKLVKICYICPFTMFHSVRLINTAQQVLQVSIGHDRETSADSLSCFWKAQP